MKFWLETTLWLKQCIIRERDCSLLDSESRIFKSKNSIGLRPSKNVDQVLLEAPLEQTLKRERENLKVTWLNGIGQKNPFLFNFNKISRPALPIYRTSCSVICVVIHYRQSITLECRNHNLWTFSLRNFLSFSWRIFQSPSMLSGLVSRAQLL